VLIGVPSSGFHSNGYSLVRKVALEHAGLAVTDFVADLGGTVGEALLRPTRIYADLLVRARQAAGLNGLHAIAHITGGGIADNLERVLPQQTRAIIRRSAWNVPAVFRWLQQLGSVAETEMFSVFNMGIGLILAVPAAVADAVQSACSEADYPAVRLGHIEVQSGSDPTVVVS
jgi:phosphoribosylformylglycinamidine cyclo-ligase